MNTDYELIRQIIREEKYLERAKACRKCTSGMCDGCYWQLPKYNKPTEAR